MALVSSSQRDFRKRSYGKVDYDPAHNDWTLSSRVDRDSENYVSWMKDRDHHFKKYKKIFSPCLLPFLRFPAKNNGRRVEVSEFTSQTNLLSSSQMKSLEKVLPPAISSLPWTLTFSTQWDGFSLDAMYKQLSTIESPVLLVIEDTEKRIFGAYSSDKIVQSSDFYGTTECFLFTCWPEFKHFATTGVDAWFVKSTFECLRFGSADDSGNPGLCIDSELCNGKTGCSNTFDNPPLIPESKFVIRSLECWTFG